jgi:hypothetical protein
MPFKFLMYAEGGKEIGAYESAVPNWVPGDTLYISGEVRDRILAVIPSDEVDSDAYKREVGGRTAETNRSNDRRQRVAASGEK